MIFLGILCSKNNSAGSLTDVLSLANNKFGWKTPYFRDTKPPPTCRKLRHSYRFSGAAPKSC
jgi:hypothetical protein